jgi:hypothetical protein
MYEVDNVPKNYTDIHCLKRKDSLNHSWHRRIRAQNFWIPRISGPTSQFSFLICRFHDSFFRYSVNARPKWHDLVPFSNENGRHRIDGVFKKQGLVKHFKEKLSKKSIASKLVMKLVKKNLLVCPGLETRSTKKLQRFDSCLRYSEVHFKATYLSWIFFQLSQRG